MRRGRIAEPGVVGDVDEQRRSPHEPQLLGAVGVLVADRRRQRLARRAQRRRVGAARLEVRIRQVHEPQPLAHRPRHREEFAEGHQPALVVPLHGLARAPRPRSSCSTRRSPASRRIRPIISDEPFSLREPRHICARYGRTFSSSAGIADSGQTITSAPRCGTVRSAYSCIVRSRWPGSHFIDCGTAPCTSATRIGAPAVRVHSMRVSAVPRAPDAQDDDGSRRCGRAAGRAAARPARPR